MRFHALAFLALATALLAACSERAGTPTVPSATSVGRTAAASWGPEEPPFNLQVILRNPTGGEGHGLVKFRQPNDADLIIYLDTWARDLSPHTSYALQRAVDAVVDDDCTSTAWLTLGKGLTPQALTTDETGTARESLFRSVAAFPVGSEFDIHFRIVDDATQSTVALQSECYQFTISQ
jgi:hypothetical protein